MKKHLAFVAVVLALGPAGVSAQEPPEKHLELIRNLRSKGYADLALEHIRKLEANPPAAIAGELFLEGARTLIFLARKEDPDKRIGMLNQARANMEDALKKLPAGPDAAKIRVELARLSTYQGQAALSRALREETIADQQKEAYKAETLFIEAGGEIEQAGKLAATEKEKRQNMFDLANNIMEQSRCYVDTANDKLNRKKAVLISQARKLYEGVAKDEKDDLSSMATAWLVKCCLEMTDPDAAKKYYKETMAASGPGADAARRWARYFNIEAIRGKHSEVRKEAGDWLKENPAHHKTAEGYGVRWELTVASFREAQNIKDQTSKEALKAYEGLQKLLSTQSEPDNDYAERANQLNIQLSLMRVSEKANIDDLLDFDDCYLRAQVELGRARQVHEKMEKIAAEVKDQKARDGQLQDLAKEQKGFLRMATRVLIRGLALADRKVPPSRIDDARFMLLQVYFAAGDLWRAGISGEMLAKALPTTKRTSQGAGLAIEAYAALYDRENLEFNRARLQEMLDFVLSAEGQKRFQHDRVTGVARFQAAMLANKDGDTKAAIALLEKMPTDFPAYIFSQGRLVRFAEEARKKVDDPREKKFYQDIIRKTVARMPKLPRDTDKYTAQIYFNSMLKEPEYLYSDAAPLLKDKQTLPQAAAIYVQMSKLLDGLDKEMKQAGEVESRAGLEYYLNVLRKYATLGLSNIEYRQGQYDKVLGPTLAGPVVDFVRKKVADEKVAKLADFQITGEILGLALRSNVQLGKIEEAKKILVLLENLKNAQDGGEVEASGNVLNSLVNDLAIQIDELRQGDKAVYAKTVQNFTGFIDELLKQKEIKGGGLELREIVFLAKCYDSLNQHEKAASLYSRYPAPDATLKKDPKKTKFTQEEEGALQTYWFVRLKLATQLRLAKKFEEANKLIDELLGHPNGRLQLPASKERIHIYEDKGFWAAGIKLWGDFLKNPSLLNNMGKNNELKDMYFKGYYHNALCWYKYSQKADLPRDKADQSLTQAASYIVRSESSMNKEGWDIVGPMFQALMQREKPLLDAYNAYKKLKGN